MQVCGDVSDHLQADAYRPPPPLSTFLEHPNPPPVYIGFGALSIPDPLSLTELIYDAAKASGKRIVLSRGWADLGKGVEKPENVCLVGNCPHSWLFPKCSAAVHHGGAGTIAAAMRAGIPSLVVCTCHMLLHVLLFSFCTTCSGGMESSCSQMLHFLNACVNACQCAGVPRLL